MSSSTDADALYALLPAFVRMRDQTEGGGVLQALVEVIAGQAQVVSAALDQQYNDQFIETCALWAVPYIGDLIGFTPLRPLGPGQPSATRIRKLMGVLARKGYGAALAYRVVREALEAEGAYAAEIAAEIGEPDPDIGSEDCP